MARITSFEQYQSEYKKSVENPEAFWEEIANEFSWKKKWDKVLDWNFEKPEINWFIGGKLNITENCLDRHLEKRADQVAFHFEPNDPNENSRAITYRQLVYCPFILPIHKEDHYCWLLGGLLVSHDRTHLRK